MLKKWLTKIIRDIIWYDEGTQKLIRDTIKDETKRRWLLSPFDTSNPTVRSVIRKAVLDLANNEEMRFSNTEEFLDKVIERIKRKQIQ